MLIPKNNNILTYLRSQHINIPAPCNGQGLCGKCKVIIKDSVPLPLEKQKLTQEELTSFVRLACQRTVLEDTEISIPKQSDYHNQDQLFYQTKPFHPHITLEQQGDYYIVFRNGVQIGETLEYKAYAFAIDIGTTTIAIALLNLTNGAILDYQSLLNPQTAYGSDVISRIDHAKDEHSLKQLSSLIRTALEKNMTTLLHKHNIDSKHLYDVVISANTTMVYLLLNKDPSKLAVSPYKADLIDRVHTNYHQLFNRKINALVTIFEGLDAFIGGDIMSGIISKNLQNSKAYNLFIDLGTNGEMVLLNNEYIYATSTALGPAFEGVNISCGVGAINGAIDHFTYPNLIHTINNQPPIGLCGSGLIEVVSELLQANIIRPTGRLEKDFYLTKDIFITQDDIRQVQLAKAAVKAGMEHLFHNAKIDPSQIEQLYIAGGFGQYTNPLHMISLSMIPSSFAGKTTILGNASLNGAIHYLSSPIQEHYVKNHHINIISLTTPLFQKLFVENMHFPKKSTS